MKYITRNIKAILFLSIIIIIELYAMGYYSLYRQVYINDGFDGAYNPITDTYLCKTKIACIHEQGHSYDAHGAWYTGDYRHWHSANIQFRENVDAIYACTSTIFTNYNVLHTEYPKTSKTLMAIEWRMNEFDEFSRYFEIYAELYAIMKTHKWDIYHYNDVEDMTTQHLAICEDYLILTEALANND